MRTLLAGLWRLALWIVFFVAVSPVAPSVSADAMPHHPHAYVSSRRQLEAAAIGQAQNQGVDGVGARSLSSVPSERVPGDDDAREGASHARKVTFRQLLLVGALLVYLVLSTRRRLADTA